MADDLLGGFGGLLKGLSSFMPQDDPAVKLMGLQTEVSDLKKKEKELYVEIGMQAIREQGAEHFGESAERLALVQANLKGAEEALSAALREQEETDRKEKAEREARTCPECGHENPEGMRFCQECGTKLGAPEKLFCPSCGAEVKKGVRFCGSCGAGIREE